MILVVFLSLQYNHSSLCIHISLLYFLANFLKKLSLWMYFCFFTSILLWILYNQAFSHPPTQFHCNCSCQGVLHTSHSSDYFSTLIWLDLSAAFGMAVCSFLLKTLPSLGSSKFAFHLTGYSFHPLLLVPFPLCSYWTVGTPKLPFGFFSVYTSSRMISYGSWF